MKETDPDPTSDLAQRTDNRLSKFGRFRPMVEAVIQDYDIPTSRVFSRKRDATTAAVRQILMAMLYWHTDETLVKIGSWFDRDHGTVIHAREKIRNEMEVNNRMRAYVNHLERTFFGIGDGDGEPDRVRLDKRMASHKLPDSWEA